MDVGLVTVEGAEPAAEGVAATLSDGDVSPVRVEAADAPLGDDGPTVVCAPVGADAVDTVSAAARDAGRRWVGVEVGGVGGRAVEGVGAAAAGFGPEAGCHDCLRTRVAAGSPGEDAESPGEDAGEAGPADEDATAAGAGSADAPAGGTGDDSAGGAGDRSAARLAGVLAGRALLAELGADGTGSAAGAGGGEAAGAFAGADLYRTVDGRRLGRVVEVPHAERTYLPVPGCACHGAGGAAAGGTADAGTPAAGVRGAGEPAAGVPAGLGFRERTLDRALRRAELALDERVGPVASVGESESFPAPYYLAATADTTGFSDARAAARAAGVDGDWDRAFVKALGEALERYGAGVYRTDAFRSAPPSALLGAVSPAAFVRPEDAPEVDPSTPVPWVPAVELAAGDAGGSGSDAGGSGDTSAADPGGAAGAGDGDGAGGDPPPLAEDPLVAGEAFLPAETVLFPPPESRYVPRITTGLGLGNSPVGAALSGLYEVIERDAAMVSWYSTFEPLGLAVEDADFGALARRARSEGLSVTPLLVTVDVDVPVVTVAVHRDPGAEWPRFAVGAAADLDPASAARSALSEAVQNWMELRSMGPEAAAEEPTAIARYAEFPAAARSLVDVDARVPADSVADAADRSGRAELRAVLDRVGAAGLDVYLAALTTRDLARVGFSAVRVAVPGAQPLFVDRPAFGRRARTVPADLGFEARLDREPHPYP